MSSNIRGDCFPNQVAKTKILVAMVPKVVAAWRAGYSYLKSLEVVLTAYL